MKNNYTYIHTRISHNVRDHNRHINSTYIFSNDEEKVYKIINLIRKDKTILLLIRKTIIFIYDSTPSFSIRWFIDITRIITFNFFSSDSSESVSSFTPTHRAGETDMTDCMCSTFSRRQIWWIVKLLIFFF